MINHHLPANPDQFAKKKKPYIFVIFQGGLDPLSPPLDPHMYVLLICLKIFFTLTNSVDPDEMQHYAAFHLSLHFLQKYSFRGFGNTKGYRKTDILA